MVIQKWTCQLVSSIMPLERMFVSERQVEAVKYKKFVYRVTWTLNCAHFKVRVSTFQNFS